MPLCRDGFYTFYLDLYGYTVDWTEELVPIAGLNGGNGVANG